MDKNQKKEMTRPNIIVFVLDCVRARNMSCYGYSIETTPHLDAFAAENVLFRRAFTTSTWTIPTHASMLTGLYLSQHRIETIKGDRYFNEQIVTLPVALARNGYTNVAFSQNMLFSPAYFNVGFAHFFSTKQLYQGRSLARHLYNLAEESKGGIKQQVLKYLRKVTSLRVTLDGIRDWVQNQPEQSPYFMMVNIANAHYPWAPPLHLLLQDAGYNIGKLRNSDFTTLSPWDFNSEKRQVTEAHREMWTTLYNAAVKHVDREMGRFLTQLRKLPSWQNTIVVITADHGEMLGDYRDIVGHTLSLHENIVHVPMLLRHPAYASGLEVEGVVQTLDLFSSILEWSGTPAVEILPSQKQRPPLSKALAVPAQANGFAFAEEDYTDDYQVLDSLLNLNPEIDPKKYPRRQVMVRSAAHKYIWHDEGPGEFYHLETDPDQAHNLVDSQSDQDQAMLTALQSEFQKWQARLDLFPPRAVPKDDEMDPDVTERLRVLGYIA